MTQFTRAVGKLPFMEIVGIFFAGVGVCFAIAVVGVAFDDNRASDEKPKIQQSVEEMKQKLIAAKVPEEQISGLLLAHKGALVTTAVHQHFIITSFLVLLSLLVALLGFTLILLGKLRANTRNRGVPC